MNYIGSKYKLSNFILETISSVVNSSLDGLIFCDIFAGTGIIGRTFKDKVAKVISNDLEYYSYVLNRHYIQNKFITDKMIKHIDELNNLESINNGFIYNEYCIGGGNNRQYFSDSNGIKIDTIRIKIEEWFKSNIIDENEYFYLLTSLIEASDKVANTASVYGAFLKRIKKSASKDLILEKLDFKNTENTNEVYNLDSNELIKKISGDILYMDPPYNQRQYGSNYHILNTIAQYDTFKPSGKTGLRDYNRSDYCKKNSVSNTFEDLIKNANFKYIFLSYNNEGLMSEDEVKSIMSRYGKYSLVQKKYQRFKADKTENRNHKFDSTFEYLHILEKY
jgi:adenine-specific DNA-methyltransferase